MVKNLLYLSIVVMFLSWFLYFLTFTIPFKVYSLEVDIGSDRIAPKVYRDFQEYINSIDPISKKYIILSNIKKVDKIIVNEDYSRVVLGMKETEGFLKNKLAPKMKTKGYGINIIPIGHGIYFAYLNSFLAVPTTTITKETLDEINDKYADYLKNDNLLEYVKFLGNYFSSSDSEKIAKNQFYISKNFLINFIIFPHTRSKSLMIHTFSVDNISKKDYLVRFQSILNKYNSKSIYLKFDTRERMINLRVLYKKSGKSKEDKSKKDKSK